MRRLVPKKNQNNMADSSEKVSFRVDMQCSSLRAEAFLVAEDFRKIGKRQSANSWPTVGRLFFGGAVLHFFQKHNEYSKGNRSLCNYKRNQSNTCTAWLEICDRFIRLC